MEPKNIRIDLSSLGMYAKDMTMLYFWVNVLLMAGQEGSFSTSIRRLAMELGMSVRQVRTCLSKLVSDTQVTQSATQLATQITICSSAIYKDERQTNDTVSDTQATHSKKKVPSKMVPDGFLSDSSSFTPLLFPQEEEKKDEDTGVSSQKDAIDYPSIQKLWNDSMKGKKIPKIAGLSQERRDKIRIRVAEMGGWMKAIDIISECFKKISVSEFCNGENDHKWVATFDWFFTNEKNWLKVLEGNYDERKRKTQLDILAENVAKADAYYEQRYRGYGGASPYGNQTGSWPYGPDEQ